MEFDIDDNVRVVRMVEDDPEFSEEDVGWDAALRNVEDFVEYASEQASPYQVIFDMMHLVDKERLNCACWVTGIGDENLLDKWFELTERGMPSEGDSIVGLPLYQLRSLPEETLILCGSKYPSPEPSEITFVVKTTLEVRSSDESGSTPSREVDGSIGDSPGELPEAANQLALAPRRLRKVDWKSASNS
jgi:hypothetical protein